MSSCTPKSLKLSFWVVVQVLELCPTFPQCEHFLPIMKKTSKLPNPHKTDTQGWIETTYDCLITALWLVIQMTRGLWFLFFIFSTQAFARSLPHKRPAIYTIQADVSLSRH
jgi:hypothetical protein